MNQGEERKALLSISVGTTGTRKTTNMKELLVVNERNLVIPNGRDDKAWFGYPELTCRGEYYTDPLDPNPNNRRTRVVINELDTFTGTRVLHVDGDQRIFDAVVDNTRGFKGGGLFLDDFRNYILTKGTLKQNVDAMFRNMRPRMLDIFMACHSWEDVSRDLMRFDPLLFVFYTTLPPTEASIDKMGNRAEFLAVIDEVQRVNGKRVPTERHYFKRFQPASLDPAM